MQKRERENGWKKTMNDRNTNEQKKKDFLAQKAQRNIQWWKLRNILAAYRTFNG